MRGSVCTAFRVRVCLYVWFGILLFTLSPPGFAGQTSAGLARVEDIIERQWDSLGAVRTLSFSSEKYFHIKDATSEPDIRSVTKYIVRGDNVYADNTQSHVGDSKSVRTLQAFNGDRFQTFYPEDEARELRVQKTVSETRPFVFAPIPALALPYMYAVAPSALEFQAVMAYRVLNDPKTRAEVSARASVVGKTTWNGMDCTILNLSFQDKAHPEKPVIRLVYCAEEWDYFPIRWEDSTYVDSAGGYMLVMSVEAKEVRPFDVEGYRPIFLPTKLYQAYYWDGNETVTNQIGVDRESIRINKNVGESVFTFSPLQAGVYNDLDNPQNNFRIPGPQEMEKHLLANLIGEPPGNAKQGPDEGEKKVMSEGSPALAGADAQTTPAIQLDRPWLFAIGAGFCLLILGLGRRLLRGRNEASRNSAGS